MELVCAGAESALQENIIREFAGRELGCPSSGNVVVQPLQGGLETCGIARVQLGSTQIVVKKLTGNLRREVSVYEDLSGTPAAEVLPRYLGHTVTGPDETYLFLEWIPRQQVWPWREVSYSRSVLERLALVHGQRVRLPEWDYSTELMHSAESTLELLRELVLSGNGPGGRPMIRTVERAVETLPAMRQALAGWHQPAVLHGDAHASNAVLRQGTEPRIVLLDWGRARLGSPLEDVSSWLQSLGFWEWEVRRRHDTLLRSYLAARGWDDRITPEIRTLYWFAAASNALAGALRYHLAVANDPGRTELERYQSSKAARDWLRMIRRADVAWRH